MIDRKDKKPAAENPEELLNLKVTEPKDWAAGVPAVYEALKDILFKIKILCDFPFMYNINCGRSFELGQ